MIALSGLGAGLLSIGSVAVGLLIGYMGGAGVFHALADRIRYGKQQRPANPMFPDPQPTRPDPRPVRPDPTEPRPHG